MFTKTDDKFAAFAADAAKRQELIANRRGLRLALFCLAIISTVILVMASWGSSRGAEGLTFGTIIQWILVFHFDAEVRLLTVLQRVSEQTPLRTAAGPT